MPFCFMKEIGCYIAAIKTLSIIHSSKSYNATSE